MAHLKLSHCDVEGLVVPAGLQLRSLHLESCNYQRVPVPPARAISAFVSLLDWLEERHSPMQRCRCPAQALRWAC